MATTLDRHEVTTILERQAAAGSKRAAFALHAMRATAELEARTGCRFGCSERGVSTYCHLHYKGEGESR